MRWHGMLVAVSLPLLVAATVHSAPRPSCPDPVIGAAYQLMQARQFDRAQTVLAPALAQSASAHCAADLSIQIEQARQKVLLPGALEKTWDSFVETVLHMFFWTAIAIMLAAAFATFGGLFRLISSYRRRRRKMQWRIYRIAPGSDPTIVKAWQNAVANGPTYATVNPSLLIVSGIPLPRTVIAGSHIPVDVDVFQGAPDIEGVSLSWISSIVGIFIRYCRSPRRTLAVAVTNHEKSAIATIEACDEQGIRRAVSGVAVWTGDADFTPAIESMAAALALKTNYLLANDTQGADIATLTLLQSGIEKLNAYSEQNDPTALRQAVEAFAAAGKASPNDPRPPLYKGIALDMLGNHDEARRMFNRIGGSDPITATTTDFQMQAAYNLAVSHLGLYQPAEIQEAARRFQLIDAQITALPAASATTLGLQAFAQAAEANAIAHYFMFWNVIGIPGPVAPQNWSPAGLDGKEKELQGWAAQAEKLIQDAYDNLKDYFRDDPILAVQLNWLICNARGNLALYRARCTGPAGVTDPQQTFTQALEQFRKCETLVKPGVDTLTSLATTLLWSGQPTRALEYTRRARALNPGHEYAWYREYQIQQARGDRTAMISLLSEANATLGVIEIPEFRKEFEDAGVRFYAC